MKAGGDAWFESELLRVRARTMRARGERTQRIEACYRDAIAVARAQSARLFELRASTELARYLVAAGKAAEARELLKPVYDGFAEGFDTCDLREANALLTELR